jgi:multidrug efflux pump subunit AcrB
MLAGISAMIGVPTFYNLAFVPTDNAASMDAEIYVSLSEGHRPTIEYQKKIREDFAAAFPSSIVYFQPADIVSQVLNFGVTAPIDVQIEGQDFQRSLKYAVTLRDKMRTIPGLTDISIQQVFDYPTLHLDIDRQRAAQVGVSQRDVANNMLVSLSSSALVAPSYYLNPENSVNYPVVVKTPIRKISSVDALLATPITPPGASVNLLQPSVLPPPGAVPASPAQRLGNLGTLDHVSTLDLITHVNVQRTIDVRGNPEGRDLGSITADIQKIIDGFGKLPAGTKITIHGQSAVMRTAFGKMALGLILSIILVYLLMVVLFQSWLDPFLVVIAVPGALIGIVWMLAITGTTINVNSLMGSIMAVGIATANSILLVSFANEYRSLESLSPLDAAVKAARTRLRPVVMTSSAMILGLLPMALGLGEGGSQNAPLGRAVIGGLLVATQVTLFIVPAAYAVLRKREPTKHLIDERFKEEVKGSAYEQS